VAAAQREARKAILAAALDAAAKIRDAQASFDSQLCEANRQVTEVEEVATDAMARADTGMEKIARLEAQLTDAIRASHQSEAAELYGRLRQLANGVRTLEQCFKAAWSAVCLGDEEIPPCSKASDEIYLLPQMRVLGDRLEALDGALHQAVSPTAPGRGAAGCRPQLRGRGTRPRPQPGGRRRGHVRP